MKEIKTSYFVLMLVAAVVVGAAGGAVYMNRKSGNAGGYKLIDPAQGGGDQTTLPQNGSQLPSKQEPSPEPAKTPPTPSPSPSPTTMSAGELWGKREQYVNKNVRVKDRANFMADCLSVEPSNPDSCATKVYIGPTPPETDYFPLTKGGKNIVCNGMPSTCGGYEKDKIYTIEGTLLRCGYADTQYCIEVK